MTTRIQIGDRWIGDGERVFVIAEAGSNHDGSLEQAKSLIEVAADAGADAVKFQAFRADRLYPPTAGTIDEERIRGPIHEALAALEMPIDWIEELAEVSDRSGLIFLCTPFDEDTVDQIDPYVPAFKVASYELTHHPLLRHIAAKHKPILLSTGGAFLDEVVESVDVVASAGATELAVLQCTAEYPAPIDAANLRAIPEMRRALGVPVGLSDHTADAAIAPIAAVALGASIIEKHYTLSRRLPGPDHAFALEPGELRAMIDAIRTTQAMLGDGRKQPLEAEMARRSFGRRALFATRDIKAGDAFSPENVAVLRQGRFGEHLAPKYLPMMFSHRSTRDILAWRPLSDQDLPEVTDD